MRKLTAWNTAKNTECITRRRQPQRYDVAHHQQMCQRLVAVTVNQQCASGGCGVHPDNLVRGRGAIGHHVALFSTERAGNVLFGFQMRAGMIEQRTSSVTRNRYIRFKRISAKEIIKQATHRAFLVCRPRRVTAYKTCISLPSRRWSSAQVNGGVMVSTEIFPRVLLNAGCNIFRYAEGVFKEPQRHSHIVGTDIHRRVRY